MSVGTGWALSTSRGMGLTVKEEMEKQSTTERINLPIFYMESGCEECRMTETNKHEEFDETIDLLIEFDKYLDKNHNFVFIEGLPSEYSFVLKSTSVNMYIHELLKWITKDEK
jgi:hypothetical protein